jgi:E3 ubiquitin-protein ligase RNF5
MSSSSAVVDSNATSDVSRPVLTRQDSRSNGGVDSRFCCNICLEAVVEPVVTQCGHLYCWPCLYRWLEPGMHPEERATLGLLRRPPAIDSSRRVCPVCKAHCCVPELVPIYVRSHEPTPPSAKGDAVAVPSSSSSQEETTDDELVSDGTTNTNAEGLEEMSSSLTGLRQRLRFRSRDSDIPPVVEDEHDQVPSRPAATSPRASPSSPVSTTPHTPQTAYNHRSNNWMTPLSSPNGHRASLSHGILLSFQQATSSASAVPPLHHRRDGSVHASEYTLVNPDATEYLSRLLIMLASFVILCLLLL